MSKILEKEFFSKNVVKIVLDAPEIARSRKPGHFVIIKIGEKGERIPLTIASADAEKGTVTLVVQKVGVTSDKLSKLEVGDDVTDVVGPAWKSNTYRKRWNCIVCRRRCWSCTNVTHC